MTFPRRLWILKEAGTLRYQVCKNNEELSVPYLSVAEHDAEVKKLREALEKIAAPTYGTELCNSDVENNEILARHHFINQKIAREALKEEE